MTSSRAATETDPERVGFLPDASAVLGKATTENFPVALRLLDGETRAHLLAIYGFARLADDLGDETSGERLAHLGWLQDELDRVYAGRPTHPLTERLAASVHARALPAEPFQQLIAANRRDQTVTRYETFADLVAYCELSANPVGHLVLLVFRTATPERVRRSDAVCTGLQLAEHVQDVVEDLARGRVYLPQEDLARFGCNEADLAAPRASEPVRRLLSFQVARARALLGSGAPLVGSLPGAARVAVAGFLAGGRAALDAIEAVGYDVLAHPSPRPRRSRLARHLLLTLARGG